MEPKDDKNMQPESFGSAKYDDKAAKLSDAEKYPFSEFPEVKGPNPLRVVKRAGGSR